MAEKKKGLIAEIVGGLASQAIAGVFDTIKEEVGDLFVEIKKEMRDLQKRHTRRAFSSMLLFIGVLFLITAAILALVQLNLSPALAFTLVGVLLLIVGGCLQYVQNTQETR